MKKIFNNGKFKKAAAGGSCNKIPRRKFKRINIVKALINGKSTAIRLYDWSMTSTFFKLGLNGNYVLYLNPKV